MEVRLKYTGVLILVWILTGAMGVVAEDSAQPSSLAAVESSDVHAAGPSSLAAVEDSGASNDQQQELADASDASAPVEKPPRRTLVPTHEWQTIEEDMGIPAGLHVRMDFQTGKKEAKLLDPEDAVEQGESVANLHLPRDQRQGIINTKRMVFTQDQLAGMAQRDELAAGEGGEQPAIGYDQTGTEAGPDESLDDIARKFAQSRKKVRQMGPRADVEIMKALVDMFNNESSSEEQRLIILEELENFVHQVDNARDMEVIGGMDVVVGALTHSDAQFRSKAALILGSAMQANPPVQKTVLERDVLPTLLEFLKPTSQEPTAVRRPSLFALSALVRSHAEAQRRLWELNGLAVLKDLCQLSAANHVPALCVKAITLISDILEEQASDDSLGKYERLLPLLEASGWCSPVAGLLSGQDNDVLEKAVSALQAMAPVCGNHVTRHTAVLQQLAALEHHWQQQSVASDDADDQYFATMQGMARRLHAQLTSCATHSNCTALRGAESARDHRTTDL